MLIGIVGIAIILWALWAGVGTRGNNRALIFQGHVGTLFNIVAIGLGAVLIFVGFW